MYRLVQAVTYSPINKNTLWTDKISPWLSQGQLLSIDKIIWKNCQTSEFIDNYVCLYTIASCFYKIREILKKTCNSDNICNTRLKKNTTVPYLKTKLFERITFSMEILFKKTLNDSKMGELGGFPRLPKTFMIKGPTIQLKSIWMMT